MTLKTHRVRSIISLALKAVIIIYAFYGVGISMFTKVNGAYGGIRKLLFFTIQSNIWIALTLAYGAYLIITGKKMSKAYCLLSFIFTVSITLTRIVFGLILAPMSPVNPWGPASIMNHDGVPLLSVIDFFICCPFGEYRNSYSLYSTLPPIYYCILCLIGYVLDWEFQTPHKNYPYFFLNWGGPEGAFGFSSSFPFMGVVWWIVAIAAFLILVAFIYIKVSNVMGRKLRK